MRSFFKLSSVTLPPSRAICGVFSSDFNHKRMLEQPSDGGSPNNNALYISDETLVVKNRNPLDSAENNKGNRIYIHILGLLHSTQGQESSCQGRKVGKPAARQSLVFTLFLVSVFSLCRAASLYAMRISFLGMIERICLKLPNSKLRACQFNFQTGRREWLIGPACVRCPPLGQSVAPSWNMLGVVPSLWRQWRQYPGEAVTACV